MPPFEGFDPTNHLRGGSSLYDNIVEEVNTYSNEFKHQFQTSFKKMHHEDVVATRDIIVGKHPLYEPGSPEYDQFVGSDKPLSSPPSPLMQQQQLKLQQQQSIANDNSRGSSKQPKDRRETSQKKKRKNGSAPVCNTPEVALEWLDLFAGICLATSNRPKDFSENTCSVVDVSEQPPTWSRPVQKRNGQDGKEDEGPQSFVPSADPVIQTTPRVLYPIAKYPSRLDSARLVEQRRKFLENQVSFKPLRLDTHKPRKPKKIPVCVKGY
eukprot:scaffold456_cov171-Amphora_coffeaeformis.AAC.8